MVKKYAYITDERLGNVYFPIAAACISAECSDLREKFTVSLFVLMDCEVFSVLLKFIIYRCFELSVSIKVNLI